MNRIENFCHVTGICVRRSRRLWSKNEMQQLFKKDRCIGAACCFRVGAKTRWEAISFVSPRAKKVFETKLQAYNYVVCRWVELEQHKKRENKEVYRVNVSKIYEHPELEPIDKLSAQVLFNFGGL